MSHVFIGGSAATTSLPCRTYAAWHALLDALASGDDAAVLRVALGDRPQQVATASMKSFAPHADAEADLDEATTNFWRRYAERHGDPARKQTVRRDDCEYSVSPLNPLPEKLVRGS